MAGVISTATGLVFLALLAAIIYAEAITSGSYARFNGASRTGKAVIRFITDLVIGMVLMTLLWTIFGAIGGLITMVIFLSYGQHRVGEAQQYRALMLMAAIERAQYAQYLAEQTGGQHGA
jgi:hypothetical protein